MPQSNARLSGPTQLTNAAVTQYTVPASTVTTIQHIHVSNPSVSPVGFTLSLGADAAATRIYDAYSIAAGGVLDVFTKYVLTAAQIVQAYGSSAGALVLRIDGIESVAG